MQSVGRRRRPIGQPPRSGVLSGGVLLAGRCCLGGAGDQSLISQIGAPAETVAPTSAERPVTVPDLWALRGCSIFMASRTTMRSPSATVAPSSTAILTIVPCIGEVRESPEAAEILVQPARRDGFFFPAAAPATATAAPPTAPRPAGSTTSSRLPPTSTVTFSRSPSSAGSPSGPSYGVSWLSYSVSIHRVWTLNPSVPTNAGSDTTAWWNGITVGIP